jgi:hypothetical protein
MFFYLLPKGMVDDLWLWKQECPDSSPDAFMFPNTDGGFMDTGNYRNRILTPLAEKLGLPKLNFQVLRRTMATLAQRKGSVKDVQAHLRHSKADTTANEYMQELPESVGRMVESMHEELMNSQTAASADLLPNATNEDGSPTAICMKEMVGTRRLELLTSTVSRFSYPILPTTSMFARKLLNPSIYARRANHGLESRARSLWRIRKRD